MTIKPPWLSGKCVRFLISRSLVAFFFISRLMSTFFFALIELLFVVFSLVFAEQSFTSVSFGVKVRS